MTDEPVNRIDPANGICATVVTFYAALYPELREAARQLGYALTLHGSLRRDLDVVAIPWTEDAADESTLVAALVEVASGFTVTSAAERAEGRTYAEKPHGRRAYAIAVGAGGGFVDLSIMPRVVPPTFGRALPLSADDPAEVIGPNSRNPSPQEPR